MAITAPSYVYCTSADIDRKLSAAGGLARTDDTGSGSATTGVYDDAIYDATDFINVYLLGKYYDYDLATSPLVNRIATCRASLTLCERRGDPTPASLLREWKEYLDLLDRIMSGVSGASVPNLSLRADTLPTVSNTTFNARYRTNKVRVDVESSTGPIASPGRIRPDDQTPAGGIGALTPTYGG